MSLRFKPGGVGQYFGPTGHVEVHTSTCFHCSKITEFPSLKRMMDYVEICRGCMRLICLECHGKPCRPHMKELERIEKENELRLRIQKDGWGCY